ncbi:PLP-dependent aminotransferase family protein [Luteipulveratus sp. YIM 133132]|uniref:aminotransferase-like domain-containing protein n=1 Tax=Luteipulveratus flavus TaxID=3031728 RepID=UPI0023AFB024|nr:PLP-dependent aminotransferase family protein [Luteipulveratus sp. YIM 133132]MDE9367805.1 PLP-dependent aminotransferase family protein [Luteipulveratus sp. YIM 133132]
MTDTPTLPLAGRAADLVGSVIDSSTSLLAKQRHDIVRFAMGSPAPEAIPTHLLAQIGVHEIGAESPDAFDYAATEGDPTLRDALLTELEGTTDATTPERLTITSGGMQGLDLAFKLFVDPGDLVVVESPTYTNGSATARSYQGELLEVPVDAEGMQVDRLEEMVAAGRPPKVIYTIPTFQNPSGASMSLERRHRLLELADRWGSLVIDDDPYGMLRFAGEQLPSLHELADGDPLVLSVRTFSKVIAPGLRVGWVDAAPELQQLLINAKQAMDTCTNLPMQRLIAGFLRAGYLRKHVAVQREVYRQRKLAMQTALAEQLGDRARWTDPEGGFFLWVTFEDDVDTEALFEVALAEGVAFIPGNAFSPGKHFPNALRVCFAATSPARIHEGVARLRRAVDRVV